LVEPKAKTGGAAVVTVTLTGAELMVGPPIFAAPNVNGTAGAGAAEDFFSDSVLTAVGCAGFVGPKLIAVGATAAVVVIAGEGATDDVVDVEVDNSEVTGRVKVGIGKPPWGLDTSAGVLDRLNVTVAGLVTTLETKSGTELVVVMVLPVLVVEILPRDSRVDVVLVDSVAVVVAVDDAATSAELSVEGLEPKAKGNPPLLESYAGGGASNFSPNWKGNPPDFETTVTVDSSVRCTTESSLGFSLGVRAF